jgi:membrane-associated phospholipid phosphatase
MKIIKILLLGTLLSLNTTAFAVSNDFCDDFDPLLNECNSVSSHYINNPSQLHNDLNPDEDDHGIFIPLPYDSSDATNFLRMLGVVGIMMAFDQQIMDTVQDFRNDTTDSMASIGYYLGGQDGIPHFILGSMATALVFRNENLRRTTISAVGNLALTGAIVEILKALSHRHRPRQGDGPYVFDGASWPSDNTSFPSGHSVAAWSIATIFATNYRETRWVPVVAYSLATLVSLSRVNDNAHWLSDVTLSAGIAYFVGKLFRRRSDEDRQYSGGLTIAPAVLQGGMGVTFEWTRRTCRNSNDDNCVPQVDYVFDEKEGKE